MAVRSLVLGPSTMLRTVSQTVVNFDAELYALLHDLRDTLVAQTNPRGVGLSAIQIGIPKRIFLAVTDHDRESETDAWEEPIIFINPKIVKVSLKMTPPKVNGQMMEGCLSLPLLYGEVRRHEWVEISYETCQWDAVKKGKAGWVSVTKKYVDFAARVIQHEMDHLDGILFTQRVLEQNGRIYQSKTEQGKEILEEISLL